MKNLNLHRIGEKHITCDGYEAEIIEYKGTSNVNVRLNNNHIITVQYGHLIRGEVKNPYHPSIFDVGFVGVGEYKTKQRGKQTKFYTTWRNMLKRACSENHKKEFPSYTECSVDMEWYNFQKFAKWMEQNYNLETMEDWHLDKDILIKGNKIYSPETCCFVPQEVNSFFVKGKSRRGACPIGVNLHRDGKFMVSCNVNKKIKNLGYFTSEVKAFQVYKTFKENLVKELANKWKGSITKECYQAMYNYKVEITD